MYTHLWVILQKHLHLYSLSLAIELRLFENLNKELLRSHHIGLIATKLQEESSDKWINNSGTYTWNEPLSNSNPLVFASDSVWRDTSLVSRGHGNWLPCRTWRVIFLTGVECCVPLYPLYLNIATRAKFADIQGHRSYLESQVTVITRTLIL